MNDQEKPVKKMEDDSNHDEAQANLGAHHVIIKCTHCPNHIKARKDENGHPERTICLPCRSQLHQVNRRR